LFAVLIIGLRELAVYMLCYEVGLDT